MAEIVANFELENNEISADMELSNDNNIEADFVIYSTGTTWGNISGDITNQTDLSNALSTLQTNIQNEATTRANKDSLLDSDISTINGKINGIEDTLDGFGNIVTHNVNEFATASQGQLAESSLQSGDNISELVNDSGYITNNALSGYATESWVIGQGYTTNEGTVTSVNNVFPDSNGNVTIVLPDTQVQADWNESNVTSKAYIKNKPSIPSSASDVGALPDNTKYGKSIDLALNTTDYKLTISLKDQDGTVLNSKVVDFPLESVVVSGAYDSVNKKVILTLQNGSTIDFSVADLISGLQEEITSNNKLDSDLVDDTNQTHKFVTTSEKQTWNNKQDNIADLSTIRSGATAGATAVQPSDLSTVATSGSYNDLSDKPTIPTVPTNVSAFTNDSGYITSSDLQESLNDKQDKLTAGTDLEILNGSSLHDLPSGYTELEYVQSSGTQYLDTGVAYKDGIRAEIDFQYVSVGGTAYTFGFNDYLGYLFYVSSGVYTINASQSTNYSASIFNKNHISATFNSTNNIPSITATVGSETKTFTRSNAGGPPYNLQIFTSSGQVNYASTGRCYGVKIYDNDVLVMELVPAIRTSDNKVGMYDTVGNTFKTNSGTGNLIASAPAVSQTIINFTNDTGYITGIDSSDVTTALGYTPVNPSNLSTVATSGSYNDLSNKPTIPTVNNATLTIQKNGTNVQTFTANSSSNKTANITVPTDTNDLTNGAGFITGITSSDVTTALGYTPYNSTNPSGYITGITSSDVTTALGYTPYNSSNPNGYTSNVGTVTSVNNTQPDSSGNVSLTIPDVDEYTSAEVQTLWSSI